MAEAVERYSSYANGQEQTVTATLAGLGDRAVAPDRLLLYSASQGGAALPSDLKVQWMEARNWSGGPARLVPAACCLLGHPEAGAAGDADSNGCAAGETLEDAALRGFYELVEREAAAFWWYHRARRPGVDLDAIAGGVPAFLHRLFARNGWNLHLLDLTTDWEIPAYAAVCDRDGRGFAYAFGAHHDPEIAAASAITELAQTVHSLSEQAHSGHWLHTARLDEHPYMAPEGCVPPAAATKGGLDDWARRAAGLGLELLTVDLTRPEIAVPVVRVLVPGIRHYQPRWAPGRLYDVPRKLGWIEGLVSEEQLNPRPCPIL
jgi:ribosomal protein S12 methylthiotransferase accessory factor